MNNLPVSSFSNVHGAMNSRILVEKSSNNELIVSTEKLGSRIVSWLGQWPLFNNINAIKEHTEKVGAKSQEALFQFTSALAEKYDKTHIDIRTLLSSMFDDKPLTKRLVQYSDDMAKTLFSEQSHTVMSGRELRFEGASGHEKIFKEGNESFIDVGLKGIAGSIPELMKLNGEALKDKFTELVSSNGALRRLMTASVCMNTCAADAKTREFFHTMLNTPIYGIPLSQWGTPGGVVEDWIAAATPQQLNNAAKILNTVAKEYAHFLVVAQDLEGDKALIRQGVVISAPDLGLARFRDFVDNTGKRHGIHVNPLYQVRLNDGTPMPVSKLVNHDHSVALAGSYPKNTTDALEAHFRMLLDKNCSALVVLTPYSQISKSALPQYFTASKAVHGSVNVTSKLQIENELCDIYKMNITYKGLAHSLPVIHAKNWPDHGILPSSNDLLTLTQVLKDNKNVGYKTDKMSENHLPMIHCLGGVGRTGTMAAALELLDNPDQSIEDIRKQFCESRNTRMMEDQAQRDQLLAMKDILIARMSGAEPLYQNIGTNRNKVDEDETIYESVSGIFV